jgi:hypothetical protein
MIEQRHEALWEFYVAVELFKDIHDQEGRLQEGRILYKSMTLSTLLHSIILLLCMM